MIRFDEDALICDLAETYHIFDYKALPLSTVAVLAVGLREDSRIKMKISGIKNIPPQILIDVLAVDTLRAIFYAIAGTKESKRSESMLSLMMGDETKEKMQGFTTAEEFEAERQRIINGNRNHNR